MRNNMLRNRVGSAFYQNFRTYTNSSLHSHTLSYGEDDKFKVTLIPGDGIGPEITDSVLGVFQAAGVPITWEKFNVPTDVTEIPSDLFASIAKNKVVLKGPLSTVRGKNERSRNHFIRETLNLYANVVPCFSNPGIQTRHNNVDFVVVRENTEGEYIGKEQTIVPGVVQSLKITTFSASTRIARFAFDYATQYNRKKVTAVHKANIQKYTDGEFLKACREVAKDFPHIEYTEMIVDNCAMQLVMNPGQFDVMVTSNLYGNVVTNAGTGLVGGPGIVPGANIGRDIAMFEVGGRHVGLDIAGQNEANPCAMLFSSVMMLRHMGLTRHAQNIDNSVHSALAKMRTRDLEGRASTTEFTQAVIDNLLI